MNELQIGILGVGNIGVVHLQNARTVDGVAVEAVADALPENRRRAETFGVGRTYSDYEDLLRREELDAVIVALPPFLHAEAATLAAEEGCHVFVEKPFARTAEEARRIVDAADRAGVRLGVDHTIRYQTEMQRLKERYDEGAVGHVPLCVLSRINNGPFGSPPVTEPVPTWQLDPEATGGGALIDLGVHLFDVLEWFFGDVEVCHAETTRQLDLAYEDAATVTVKSGETGTLATLNCGFYQWEEPPDVNMYFRLDGITDTLRSEQFMPNNLLAHAGRSAVENVAKRLTGGEPDYFEPTYFYRAHYRALRDFLLAVRENRRPPVSGEEGLKTVELVSDAYDAAGFDPGVETETETETGTAADGGERR